MKSLLFALAFATALPSCQPDQPRAQAYDQDEYPRESRDNYTGYDPQRSHPASHYQQEDHTLRNAILAGGAGYLAGRAHASYKTRQQTSRARSQTTSSRRSTYGSFGRRSRRRR